MAHPLPDILRAPAFGEPSDAALIEDSLRRPERFASVFDRHYDAIHGYAARRLGPGLADDIASETFLIAFDRRTHDRRQARPAALSRSHQGRLKCRRRRPGARR